MNPHASNPLMFILEADPDRYIKTPAAAVVAVIKAVEGVFAFMWCFRMLDCLREIVVGRQAMAPLDVLCALLPGNLVRLVLPAAALPGGTLFMVLGGAAALCVLAELVCMTAEAVAAVLLRFFDKGAKLFKSTRKWILAACFVLTLCMILSCVPQVMGFVRGGFRVDASLQPLIVCLLVSLLLILRVCYHRAAAVVITAVEYELRLGYKETGMERVRLGWFSFLQGLLLLAASAALFVYARAEVRYAAVFLLPAVKFFAVWKAWRVFRRCHR